MIALSTISISEVFKNTKPTIDRWPALSVSIIFTTLSFLLLFGLAGTGWPGPVTSNCYEDYLTTADCYCERLRGNKPGDVWMAQPMNTVTNLFFVFAGFIAAYSSDSKKFPSESWWKNDNLITRDNTYTIVYSLSACLLGVGSTFLHASFTTFGRQLDMIGMYFVGTFMVLYPLLRDGLMTKDQAKWIYVLGNLGLILWLTLLATQDMARKLFTTIIVSSWLIEIFMVDPKWAQRNQESRKIFFSNILMFCVAVLQWKASESGGPLCDPESIFQGHSLWHFQSALGTALSYFYYLGEKTSKTGPINTFLLENTEKVRGGENHASSGSFSSKNSLAESTSSTSYDSSSECSES